MYNNIYDIRCIIKLNEDFDYYNDILPLCIELKLMIKYIKEQNILVIFSKSLNNRFYDKPIYKTFIESIINFDSNNYDDEALIWKDVLNYSLNYKYNNEFDKYNDEELYYMNNRFIEIENNYDLLKLPDDISSEYGELFPFVEYYHIIISNKDRFEKIKNQDDLASLKVFINNVSGQYNIDKKNIIKDFLNYIIRNKENLNVPEYFNFVENIIHFEDCKNSDYVNYSLIKLSTLLKESY